jgi:hypothetical protein
MLCDSRAADEDSVAVDGFQREDYEREGLVRHVVFQQPCPVARQKARFGPRLFVWTATADSIRGKLQRLYVKLLNGAH